MNDDGTNGDEFAADRIYTVIMPTVLQENRRPIRYRISAYDRPNAAGGLVYQVEFTSDLGNWNPGNVIPQSSTPSPDSSLSEVWRFMSNTQSAPRIFARLKVLLE